MGRLGIRRKELQDDLKEKRKYCKMKEAAINRTVFRTRFGRRC
jgi:hypothetical protein